MSIYRKSFFDIALDQGLWILKKKKILQHSTRSVDLDNQRLKDGDLLKGRAHLIGLVIRLESKNDVNIISDKTTIFKGYNPSVVLRDEYKETKEQIRNAQITS